MIYFIIALSLISSYFLLLPEILKIYWPHNIENKFLFQLVSMQLTHVIVYVIVNCSYGIIYFINHPYFEKFKIEQSWPWHQVEWKKLRNQTFLNFILNLGIGSLLGVFEIQQRCDRESLPDIWEMVPQFIFFLLIEDFLFYWTHRMLHLPFLYRFHKQHHTYHTTISISAEYQSVFEYVFNNLLPFIIGPYLLGQKMHLLTTIIWIGIREYKKLSDHSGYVFPWEIFQYIPFIAYSEFHSYHHSNNDGNYGAVFLFWDYVFGTSQHFYQKKQLKDQYLGGGHNILFMKKLF